MEALDRDYIQAILISIKATEETSRSIQETQEQIKKIVENQRRTLEELVRFKSRLDEYAHLDDIDQLWEYTNSLYQSIENTNESNRQIEDKTNAIRATLNVAERKIDELSKQSRNLLDKIENVITFIKPLKKVAHLKDIDQLWSDGQERNRKITALSKSIDTVNESNAQGLIKIDALNVGLAAAEKKIEELSIQSSDLIERLESIITFTSALEQVTHLNDVDEMWESLSAAHISICNITGEFDSIQNIVSKNQKELEKLLSYMEQLSGVKHLTEVDELWKRTEAHQLRINRLEQTEESLSGKLDELVETDGQMLERIDSNTDDINRLKEYQEQLGNISHLKEVDSIWHKVEGLTSRQNELSEKNAELVATIQKNNDAVDARIVDFINETNAAVDFLKKQVKYAYYIAGGAAGLAIFELLLLLLR